MPQKGKEMLIDLSVTIPVDKELSGPNKLGHLGTHLDIMDLEDVPIEKFITRGKLVDLRHINLVGTSGLATRVVVEVYQDAAADLSGPGHSGPAPPNS